MEEHALLTISKLLEILEKVENNKEVQLLAYSVKPGTEKGDNYASEIAKVDITAKVGTETKEYHWMVKIEPVITEFTKRLHLEEKEITYYKEIVPKWHRLAEERKASFRINSFDSPYSEYHEEEGRRSILVMQNLRHCGYTDAPNKKKGLTLAHAKVALEEIARFHALGYAYIKSYPEGIEAGKAANDIFIADHLKADPKTQDVFKAFTSEFMHRVGVVEEPGQDLVSVYQKFLYKNDAFEYFLRITEPKSDAFNVICHADLWFNNMLFRHADDGTPLKASLLDVSGCFWSSPCSDLDYFLYSSTTPMLRATHLEDMLGHYHDTLVRCLWELKEDPAVYSYRQLLADFNDHAFVGFWFAMLALPAVLAKKEDTISQETLSGDLTDPSRIKEVLNDAQKRAEQAAKNEPQIKVMLGGAFLDMIKRGIFEL